MAETPIVVTDTDDLQRKFCAHIYGFTLGITRGHADRLAVSLIEVLRANCPAPPTLTDATGNEWYWNAGYVDDDGNLRSRESLDDDPELSPMTEVES